MFINRTPERADLFTKCEAVSFPLVGTEPHRIFKETLQTHAA
jgi:hypothetical protein